MTQDEYVPGAADIDWTDLAEGLLRDGHVHDDGFYGIETTIEETIAIVVESDGLSEPEVRELALDVVRDVFDERGVDELARRREVNASLVDADDDPSHHDGTNR